MREIKFRFWNTKNPNGGKMLYRDLGWAFEVLNDDMAVMQFTGLLDRHGEEIYEGDIVEMDEEAKIRPNEGNRKCVVEHDGFCTYWLRPTNDRFYIAQLYESVRDYLGSHKQKDGLAGKIIGNIYENPELLN